MILSNKVRISLSLYIAELFVVSVFDILYNVCVWSRQIVVLETPTVAVTFTKVVLSTLLCVLWYVYLSVYRDIFVSMIPSQICKTQGNRCSPLKGAGINKYWVVTGLNMNMLMGAAAGVTVLFIAARPLHSFDLCVLICSPWHLSVSFGLECMDCTALISLLEINIWLKEQKKNHDMLQSWLPCDWQVSTRARPLVLSQILSGCPPQLHRVGDSTMINIW